MPQIPVYMREVALAVEAELRRGNMTAMDAAYFVAYLALIVEEFAKAEAARDRPSARANAELEAARTRRREMGIELGLLAPAG